MAAKAERVAQRRLDVDTLLLAGARVQASDLLDQVLLVECGVNEPSLYRQTTATASMPAAAPRQ